jgi:bifunctional UDP-N-acetylglucosamine pyrophosphorylase/glucosamine-1-phosphate N-acetyltransferase/UDP-N-acetylglucosamine pyrophosphorylase
MAEACIAIVLAAGKGTRMKSELPKVLVPVAGRPMIAYVLDALSAAGVDRTIVVVGYRSDLVREALCDRSGVSFVEQTEQLGTGHAVMVARPLLAAHVGPVLVVTGDSPLTQADSVRSLLDVYRRDRPACILGTAHKADPTGLGRIVRDGQGRFDRIVEHKDATDEQRRITEVNMSTYVFAGPDLLNALAQLTSDNAQREYYITDVPGILRREGKDVRAEAALKPCEAMSINTVEDLSAVEALLASGEVTVP